MIGSNVVHLPHGVSLAVIVLLLAAGVVASLYGRPMGATQKMTPS
jgi:hypothetical protein